MDFADLTTEPGTYGPRVVLRSSWQPWMAEYMRDHNVIEIELNTAKGWPASEPTFLQELPWLVSCTIIGIGQPVGSVASIHMLHHLRELKELSYSMTPINFDSFPQLERCSLEWRRGSNSLFRRSALVDLFVNRYSGHDSSVFSNLEKLQDLAIYNSPLRDLAGLSKLTRLRELRLVNLRKIHALSGITHLTNLRSLRLSGCKALDHIEEISSLTGLEALDIADCGDIASLAPVACLSHLRSLTFNGTNIIDGDLAPLMGLPMLRYLVFNNRRHYSHARRDFAAKLASSGPST
ncbi:MAG: leucine-rich repeat domain-containing protein [Fimbriimonadaceae bacterium]